MINGDTITQRRKMKHGAKQSSCGIASMQGKVMNQNKKNSSLQSSKNEGSFGLLPAEDDVVLFFFCAT